MALEDKFLDCSVLMVSACMMLLIAKWAAEDYWPWTRSYPVVFLWEALPLAVGVVCGFLLIHWSK